MGEVAVGVAVGVGVRVVDAVAVGVAVVVGSAVALGRKERVTMKKIRGRRSRPPALLDTPGRRLAAVDMVTRVLAAQGWSHTELAAVVGVDERAVRAWALGETGMSVPHVRRLQELLQRPSVVPLQTWKVTTNLQEVGGRDVPLLLLLGDWLRAERQKDGSYTCTVGSWTFQARPGHNGQWVVSSRGETVREQQSSGRRSHGE